MQLNQNQRGVLRALLEALVDQQRARVIVPPNQPSAGFWFGGGNVVADGDALWLTGRYRDFGDSTTGVAAGRRGIECTLLRSTDGGQSFTKVRSWTKADLSKSAEVLSIEGTALHRRPDGSWELFVSTEKNIPYPAEYKEYQKPGTGVWSIDRMRGPSPDRIEPADLSTVLASEDPEHLHLKDPVIYSSDESTSLIFCVHPMSWTSSNTGMATRPAESTAFSPPTWQLVSRGNVWDIAVTRVTSRLAVPRYGALSEIDPVDVLFYDGAEGLRPVPENPNANRRPRGYSCEELGGAFWSPAGEPTDARRISEMKPLFLSPFGTGSSRYVSAIPFRGGIYATWQQAQADGSQPLVSNFLSKEEVTSILSR